VGRLFVAFLLLALLCGLLALLPFLLATLLLLALLHGLLIGTTSFLLTTLLIRAASFLLTALLIRTTSFLLAARLLLALCRLLAVLIGPLGLPRFLPVASFSPVLRLSRLVTASGGPGRRVAKPTLLAGRKRLRLRNAATCWLNDVACLSYRRLALELTITEFARADYDPARNLRRPCQDARTHVVRTNRASGDGGNDDGRDAWIDGEAAAIMEHHGPIHDHGLANVNVVLGRRENDRDQPRSNYEIARPAEHPHVRLVLIFNHHVVRGQRCPADTLTAASPLHEAGAPLIARYPRPAITIGYPAAVMKGYPTPICLFPVRVPVPAPFVAIDPPSNRVGPG
jgi:hypothetical protein